MCNSDLYKIPILWHRFWMFPETSIFKGLVLNWKKIIPHTTKSRFPTFKTGLQLSKGTYFESVWSGRQVSKDTDDFFPKLWKNITGTISKTKGSKNLVFYLSMTLEAMAEPQASSLGWDAVWNCICLTVAMPWAQMFSNTGLGFHFPFSSEELGFSGQRKQSFSTTEQPFSPSTQLLSNVLLHRGSCTLVTASRFVRHHFSLRIILVTSFTPNSNPKYSNSDVTFQIMTLKYHDAL